MSPHFKLRAGERGRREPRAQLGGLLGATAQGPPGSQLPLLLCLREFTCRLDHWILPMQRGALRQACLVAKMSSSPVSW